MDTADRELFERSLTHATDSSTGAALDAALDELGWDDALALDPRVAIGALFERQGLANVTSGALDRVLLSALEVEPDVATRVLLPALGGIDAPGVVVEGAVQLRGLVSSVAGDEPLLVVAGGTAVVVPLAGLTTRTISGVDPDAGLVEVQGRVDAGDGQPAGDWVGAVALGQVALGHQLVGQSRRMLAQAREHALERVQFDRPISGFQAVRHRLAETLVAIETADAALEAAWLDPGPVTAAMAKAVAGRSARIAVKHCQQVLAGIGFTTEHPLHLSIRRVLVLDELLGSSRALTAALGADLLATRSLPPLLPL